MPESRKRAKARAKKRGIPASHVTCPKKKKCFVAPAGNITLKQKKIYAGCRLQGGKKSTCAAVMWKNK